MVFIRRAKDTDRMSGNKRRHKEETVELCNWSKWKKDPKQIDAEFVTSGYLLKSLSSPGHTDDPF